MLQFLCIISKLFSKLFSKSLSKQSRSSQNDTLLQSMTILLEYAQSLSIFYKILNNLVDVSLPDCIIPSQVQNRDHNNKLIPIQPRIDVYKFSFYSRVLLLWNNLSPNIVNDEFQDHVHKLYNIN